MNATHHRFTARVQGRVQGVGFRHFTYVRARALGVCGWVRNSPGGGVEVVAEGPPAALEALLDALRHGPSFARVTEVTATWSAATGGFDAFTVRS